jgi:L-serine dehydratase
LEQISVFDILKIGVGPSSSHTMGPWVAAGRFIQLLKESGVISKVNKVEVDLFGSLALTGKGHGTDIALILGLSGCDPKTIPIPKITSAIKTIEELGLLMLGGAYQIKFILGENIRFNYNQSLDFHPNGLRFSAFDESGEILCKETYFSVGGGFVVQENEVTSSNIEALPFPIESAKDLKKYCENEKKGIAAIVFKNELHWRKKDEVESGILKIWDTMCECVFRGCHTEGKLPGGLDVIRRATSIHKKLINREKEFGTKEEWIDYLKEKSFGFADTLKFVTCFALATNEENASFGRVVTAPTNGAAGVIPAVLLYFICLSGQKINNKGIIEFLCVASEIGCLFKKKSTIAAAMGGCQAEIGVSSSMAAAALTSGMGGTVAQSLMAAEIAMEHHLGLTCDPVKGLVQIPCIERNSMGAIKAITASQIALESNPELAKVSLDNVIKTMWDTACDMNLKYKETSLGGLAANISVSVSEC